MDEEQRSLLWAAGGAEYSIGQWRLCLGGASVS